MTDILNFKRNELAEVVTGLGEKAFRANQIFEWLAKGVASFDEMSNLPNALIDRLKEDWYIGLPEVLKSQKSKDGTIKCLFGFKDGTEVESVFMKYRYGNSICISSQAGCRMGCSFCASTMGGLDRNLTGGEMLAEVLAMKNHTDEDIGHVVVMGMGEPFDNYDELVRFIELIHDERGFDLGLRNITVSTCGLIPQIERFTKEFPQVNLAISLHAPNQKKRESLMPIASRYKYNDLIDAAKRCSEESGRRITFEYALSDSVNDSAEDARELASHLKGWLSHVNLIPLNEVKGRDLKQSGASKVKRFKEVLEAEGVAVTVRRTLGSDIDAACGQLRNSSQKKHG